MLKMISVYTGNNIISINSSYVNDLTLYSQTGFSWIDLKLTTQTSSYLTNATGLMLCGRWQNLLSFHTHNFPRRRCWAGKRVCCNAGQQQEEWQYIISAILVMTIMTDNKFCLISDFLRLWNSCSICWT